MLELKRGDRIIHKIIVLGDDHVRGCSEKLSDILGKGFRVIGTSKPNANVGAIIVIST
jgi:hypothetical protein